VVTRLRLPLLALMTMSFVLPPAAGMADPRPKQKARQALVLPLAGTGSGGVTFSGTVAVQGFAHKDGLVYAIGAVSGTLSGPTGPIGTSIYLPVAFPVTGNFGPLRPASFSAPDNSPRVMLAQATTCGVLHLDLAAVNLNLLGVMVTTTPVTIDINGDTAGPLGNLVCAALNTVNTVVDLVNVLNSILGLVTGLLGGLTGGLGGTVPI
jgi:hypothetical protein